MQQQVLFQKKNAFKIGQTVTPNRKNRVYSLELYDWETAMIYDIYECGSTSNLCTLKGINRHGVVFKISEYEDNLLLKESLY